MTRRNISVFPTQHGAWAFLTAASLLGSLAVGPMRPRTLLLIAAMFSGFIGQHALRAHMKNTAARAPEPFSLAPAIILLALSVLAAAWLIIAERLYALIVLGVISAWCFAALARAERRRKPLTLTAELSGTFALSLACLAAVYCQIGTPSRLGFGLWGVCALFFFGSVVHVRSLVRRHRLRLQGLRGRWNAAGPSVAYHLLAAAVLLYASRAMQLLPAAAVLAFCLSLPKLAWSMLRPAPRAVSVRRIGIIELCYAVGFVALTLWGYRTAALTAP